MPAPASNGYGNDLRHRGVQGRYRLITLFNYPVHLDALARAHRIGNRRQRVQHIAERRQFDQQQAHQCNNSATTRSGINRLRQSV